MKETPSHDTSHYAECLDLMRKFRRRHKWRMIAAGILLALNIWVKLFGIDTDGALAGIFAGLIIGVLAVLGNQEHLRIYLALLGTLLLATVTGCIEEPMGLPLFIVYLTAIPEVRNMQWIMNQPGYPYFNERFDEQQFKAYEPTHLTENAGSAEMPDIDDLP